MRQVQDLEAAGEALGEAALEQQGRGAQQRHLQGAPGTGIGVPQALHRLRPVRDLLDLVENEECSLRAGVAKQESSGVPHGRSPRVAPLPDNVVHSNVGRRSCVRLA